MRQQHVWVGRDEAVVVTGRGVGRWTGTAWERWRYADIERERDEPGHPEAAILGGRRAIIRRPTGHGSDVALWSADSPTLAPVEGPELDAFVAFGEQLVVCHRTTRDDGSPISVLAPATLDGARLVPGAALTWPTPTRLPWPGGIWTPGDEPAWNDEDSLEGIALFANQYGLVAAASLSGLIVAFDPAFQATFAVRLQTRDSADIFATPTRWGVLVVITESMRHSALTLIGWDGTVRAHTHQIAGDHAWGVMNRPLLVGRDTVIVMAESGGENLPFELDLTTLADQPCELMTGYEVQAHGSSHDGTRHVLGLSHDFETKTEDMTWASFDGANLTEWPELDLR